MAVFANDRSRVPDHGNFDVLEIHGMLKVCFQAVMREVNASGSHLF